MDQPWLTGAALEVLLTNPSALMPGDEMLLNDEALRRFPHLKNPVVVADPATDTEGATTFLDEGPTFIRVVNKDSPGFEPTELFLKRFSGWRRPSVER